MDRPLASLVLITYNQERYVRETVRSAFSQTYDPLEIVISDDCSTDKTAEIISQEIDAYRKSGGRHAVIFHRNKSNRGIAMNSQFAFSCASGELLVAAGGDDISLPNRVERIMEEWVKYGKRALAIYHGAITIDSQGRTVGELGEFYLTEGTLGAVAAYSKRMGEMFGPITEESAVEDEVFGRRAMILGARHTIRENLLKYRVGVGVSSGMADYRRKQIKVIGQYKLASLRQSSLDLLKVRDIIGVEATKKFAAEFDFLRAENEAWLEMFKQQSFRCRLKGARFLWAHENFKRKLLLMILLLPQRIGDAIFFTVGKVMHV